MSGIMGKTSQRNTFCVRRPKHTASLRLPRLQSVRGEGCDNLYVPCRAVSKDALGQEVTKAGKGRVSEIRKRRCLGLNLRKAHTPEVGLTLYKRLA